MKPRHTLILLTHALAGWALCAASIGIGMATTSVTNALIIHAMAAPIVFAMVTLVYYKKFRFTSPLQTALVFIGFVIAVDFFVVALLINRSLDMFTDPLGTWIPFALIFISTYLTGRAAERRATARQE
jgi:hypothetical protein